jgi:hypothetical protein
MLNMSADAADREELFSQQDARLASARGDARTPGDDVGVDVFDWGCDFGCGSEQCVTLLGAGLIVDC